MTSAVFGSTRKHSKAGFILWVCMNFIRTQPDFRTKETFCKLYAQDLMLVHTTQRVHNCLTCDPTGHNYQTRDPTGHNMTTLPQDDNS